MDSLPDPSQLVEDEEAGMRLRFSREGLSWENLSPEQKLLQVTQTYTTQLQE